MAGRKNVFISLWWAAMLPTLRTTVLDNYRTYQMIYIAKKYHKELKKIGAHDRVHIKDLGKYHVHQRFGQSCLNYGGLVLRLEPIFATTPAASRTPLVSKVVSKSDS